MSHPDDAQNRPANADEVRLTFTVEGEECYWIPQEQYQPPRPVRPGNPHSYLPAYIVPWQHPLAPATHSLAEEHVANLWGYHLVTESVEQDLTEAQTVG